MKNITEDKATGKALHIGGVIARLEALQRFDVGAWPDGCPSSDKDDDGDWICFDDVKEIIDELKANAI